MTPAEAPPVPSKLRRRFRTIVKFGLVGLCALIVVASLLIAWAVRRTFPETDGVIAFDSLSAPVDVQRDEWGVPHIYADTSADLFAAQGYVHAQDRFFEMDFRRHITSGRLAELFGEAQVETDATIRTMGWRQVAEQEYEALDDESRSYYDAYADGVNEYLSGKVPGQVSLEYTVLGLSGTTVEVEPWTAVDSIAWLKAMAWDLRGNYNDELDRAQLAAQGLSEKEISELYPPYPTQAHKPIVTRGAVVDGEFDPDADAEESSKDTVPAVSETTTDATVPEEIWSNTRTATDSVANLLGQHGLDGIGSNSWVVSGDKTSTGAPILANDPHLGSSMPSVWYQVGLHCRDTGDSCPFDITGFSFAGLPAVVIGHNAQIAWGFTNLGPDVTDFYMERLKGNKYLSDEQWHDLDKRDEVIEVAGSDPVTITVRSTSHGPIMSDVSEEFAKLADDPQSTAPSGSDEDAEYGVALRWSALDPGHTAQAIFALNTASDFDEFRDAASLFDVPAQNLVYADRAGNIGYQMPGKIPKREAGDGTMPAPGWDSDYDWDGYIDFAQLPYLHNPEEGFIVTANNQAIDTYPHLITRDWDYGYRSQRIRDLIEKDDDLSVSDMESMHNDTKNTQAIGVVGRILDNEVAADTSVHEVLSDWDFQQGTDSAGAAAFNATWRHLLSLTFDELPEDMAAAGNSRWAYVIDQLVDDPDNAWWDDESTTEVETADDILAEAMNKAETELVDRFGDNTQAWRWGEMHVLTVRNQSLGVSGIGVVESVFNSNTVESEGGGGLVNATGWDASSGNYEVTTVPSMRMVVDMADFDKSRWINLTGNSGHAYHSHYEDQLPLWAEGRQLPMRWGRDAIDDSTVATLRLTPDA